MKFKFNFQLLNVAFYVTILSLILFLILRIILVYSYAPDIGGVENNVIYNIAKVLDGGTLYDNPEIGNFNITQYTPIYYYCIIFCAKSIGLTPFSDLHSIYIIARFFSLMSNLLGMYFIFRLLTQCFSVNKKIAWIAAISFFINLTRIHFSSRPDALFGLIFILIIYAFVLHFQQKEKNNVYFIWGILLSVLSVFIKQTGFQFFVIIPMFFFLNKEYKNGFLSVGLTLFLSALLAFVFYNIYGQNFISNVVNGLNNGFALAHIYNIFSFFLMKHLVVFILGVYCSFIYFDKKQSEKKRFLSFMLIGLFFFAFVTCIKFGSWLNYYNEFLTTVIILSAITIENLSVKIINSDPVHKAASICCTILIVVSLPNMIVEKLFYEHYQHIIAPSKLYHNKQKVASMLQSKLLKNEYFLCFDDQINAMLPLKCVIPNKDLVPSQSKFNYQNFTKNYNSGNIKLVVYPVNKPFVDFMGCNFSNFKEIYKDNDFTILETIIPKPKLP
jgi:hypothetical protein